MAGVDGTWLRRHHDETPAKFGAQGWMVRCGIMVGSSKEKPRQAESLGVRGPGSFGLGALRG